jgi:hypothetical protein
MKSFAALAALCLMEVAIFWLELVCLMKLEQWCPLQYLDFLMEHWEVVHAILKLSSDCLLSSLLFPHFHPQLSAMLDLPHTYPIRFSRPTCDSWVNETSQLRILSN